MKVEEYRVYKEVTQDIFLQKDEQQHEDIIKMEHNPKKGLVKIEAIQTCLNANGNPSVQDRY